MIVLSHVLVWLVCYRGATASDFLCCTIYAAAGVLYTGIVQGASTYINVQIFGNLSVCGPVTQSGLTVCL